MGSKVKAEFALSRIESASQFIPGPAVARRYNVSGMTIYRWLHNVELGFPRPLYIGRFRFWRVDDLVAWERARPQSAPPVEALADGRRRKAATESRSEAAP
jgi:predicted DNA-binding transcriptional regulator AlpA